MRDPEQGRIEMPWRSILWVAVAVAATAAVGVAAPDEGRSAAAPRLLGYRVVQQSFAVGAQAQARGKVTCPGAKVPIGGGVAAAPGSLARSINSAYPMGRAWVGVVNNATASASAFTVYALCARTPKGYTVVAGANMPVDPPFASGQVACPAGKVPLGGGARVSGPSLAVGLTASLPLDAAWAYAALNRGSTRVTLKPYAVCAVAPAGYGTNYDSAGTNAPQHQDTASQGCATRVVGGGSAGGDGSTLPEQTIAATFPRGAATWVSVENNVGATEQSMVVAAICAAP